MRQWIQAIWAGSGISQPLKPEAAAAAAHAMANGEASDAQCAAFLTGMRMKGETEEELLAFIETFRQYRRPFAPVRTSLASGGAGSPPSVSPVSLAVALLLASAGFPQSLIGTTDHAPARVSSAPGSLHGLSLPQLLQRFQVHTELSSAAHSSIFVRTRIGYFQPADVCPPLLRFSAVREQIGIPSLLDEVERALNPLESTMLLLGVGDRAETERWVSIVPQLRFQSAYLLEGTEGTDVLPLYKASHVRIVSSVGDESRVVDPHTFGFCSEPLTALPEDRAAALLEQVLLGEDSSELQRERDHVIFNAGLRLLWFDKVASYEEGFQLAADLLRRKEAWKLLQRWRELSRELAVSERQQREQDTGT